MQKNVIDFSKKIDSVVSWIDEYIKRSNAKGIVFGVSGGVDSALLCAIANKYFPNKSLALTMHIENQQEDIDDADLILKTFDKVERIDVELEKAYIATKSILSPNLKEETLGNLKSRLRMVALYSYAQEREYLVAGTSNAAEYVTGYFTKYGDSGSDILPLVNFPKSYIIECAKILGVPEKIINKKPSAGLRPNQYDEDELGIQYKVIDDFLLGNFLDNKDLVQIIKLQINSDHKRQLPASPLQKEKMI